MQRKSMFLLTILVLLSLLLQPGGTARAQDPRPPRRTTTPENFQHPEGVTDFSKTDRLEAHRAGAEEIQNNLQAAAVPLGSSGLAFRYVQTFGVAEEPYLADGDHINGPGGIFVDGSNNLFVAEMKGHRLLKYNNAGTNTQIIGHAGLPWHHDDFMSWPQDVAIDSSGNIWVVFNPTVKKFDSSGNLILTIPETNPWETGSDDYHFDNPNYIAFDAAGLLYVADTGNHRIQVYDVSGASPVYQRTIGLTGQSGPGPLRFDQPNGIAFDSLGRLYVMDSNNYRVKRCTFSGSWSCVVFFGVTGVGGNDLNHLGWAVGITVDGADNIYIADGDNYRILKCTTASVCSHFAGTTGERGSDNNHFYWPEDVAVDSSGNVFVSDLDNHRVQRFNSAGVYQSTVGVTLVPYLTDANHIHRPWGIAVSNSGDLYITENQGYRLLKYSPVGNQLWTVGEPGIYGDDNDHFTNWWAGLEGNPAVDNVNGRIFVTDTSNDRVQIFNTDGIYQQTLGSSGSGNSEFSCPTGASINPLNGDVYIADHCNHRIQVYTSTLVYKATLGETGVEGSDNTHFRWPWNVAVANNGDIFVADSGNFRVQRCRFTTGVNYTCSTFAGETGISGSDYGHFYPMSVAVDASRRVYVVDDWNSRVLVYNSSGQFLTSIGGDWSSATGGLRSPSGVAVDKSGNVYVADQYNHRVQKFAPGVPNWQQSSLDGFGDPSVSVWALATFNNALYAGTYHGNGAGAGIWSTTDGQTWTPVMSGGFGNTENAGIDHLFAFKNYLFAGTGNEAGNPGQAWRSSNGTSWAPVTTSGFGSADNVEIFRFASFNNMIYTSTWNQTTGTQLWRDGDGAPHTTGQFWEQVVEAGFSDNGNNHTNNEAVLSFEVYDPDDAGTTYVPYLYAGTMNRTDGAEMWRSDTGNADDWEWVNTNGFGDVNNIGISALASFNGYLYASTRHVYDTGAIELWRCQICNGSDWTDITGDWSLNEYTQRNTALEVMAGYLYLAIGDPDTGIEVWRSADGIAWEQIGFDGLTTSINWTTYWDNGMTEFNSDLYLGTISSQGGKVWKWAPTTNINVRVGGVSQGSYDVPAHRSQRRTYSGLNGGPARIASTDNEPLLASQRVIYGGVSYSEIMGLPLEQLTNEYIFPYYNNVAMDSQLRVSNLGDVATTINVYLGADPAPIDTFDLNAGGAIRNNYAGKNSGPLRVTSTATDILATIRVLYGGRSYSELMGFPADQLTNAYIFPWYNNVAMDSQLRVSNLGDGVTTINVYLGASPTPIDTFNLNAGGATRINYVGKNSGPLRVTSSATNILTTLRVLYGGRSYSELMGFPENQLSKEYWYPVYDNAALDSQLRVSNLGGSPTTITVYAGGQQIDSYTLNAGVATRKNYARNTGPLHVVSDSQPILTTVRLLYTTPTFSSLYEITGLPNEQLSTQYFFPWYNNKAMNSEFRFAVP